MIKTRAAFVLGVFVVPGLAAAGLGFGPQVIETIRGLVAPSDAVAEAQSLSITNSAGSARSAYASRAQQDDPIAVAQMRRRLQDIARGIVPADSNDQNETVVALTFSDLPIAENDPLKERTGVDLKEQRARITDDLAGEKVIAGGGAGDFIESLSTENTLLNAAVLAGIGQNSISAASLVRQALVETGPTGQAQPPAVSRVASNNASVRTDDGVPGGAPPRSQTVDADELASLLDASEDQNTANAQDGFIQVVPAPSSVAMAALAFGAFLRRRR